MSTIEIMSLNVGRPRLVARGGRQYTTAIGRTPIDGPVAVAAEGLAGDEVADRTVHGGPDKALCCYPSEHYAHFEQLLGAARGAAVVLAAPAFGENLTLRGALETDLRVGDVFSFDTCTLQVSQPRQPCGKLAGRHDEPRMVRWVNEAAFCGFYFRVLAGGSLAAGAVGRRTQRGDAAFVVADLLHARTSGDIDAAALRAWPTYEPLSASWKQWAARRLAGEDEGGA